MTDRGPVVYQSRPPGPPLPKGESYLTIGWKQVKQVVSRPEVPHVDVDPRSGRLSRLINISHIPLSIFLLFSS